MKRNALFVGVDKYADGHIPDLSCAVSDATDLHGFFKYGAGYDRVELLPNPAGKKEVLSAVRELTSDLGKGDFFLFFFAGHGFRVGENHVLVCSKDLYEDVKYEEDGLPLGQLKRKLTGAFDRAVFLDACQSDILATRGGEGLAARDLSLILDAPQPAAGEGSLTVVTSCDEGQTAGELASAGHGLFTMALLDSLTAAQTAHERVELSDAFRVDLGRRMREIASNAGLPTEQRPRFSSSGLASPILVDGGDTHRAQAPAPSPAVRPRRTAASRTTAKGNSPFGRFLVIAEECGTGVGRTMGVRQFWTGDGIPAKTLANFLVAFGRQLGAADSTKPGRAIALWDGGGFPAPPGSMGFLVAENGLWVVGGAGAKTKAAHMDWRTFAGPDGCVEPVSFSNVRLCRNPEVCVQFVTGSASRNALLRMFKSLRKAAEEVFPEPDGDNRGGTVSASSKGPTGPAGMFLGCLVWLIVCAALGIVIGFFLNKSGAG